jgi:fructuronate reductase
VRLVHLGLGNFFRAHQCWYTEHAPDADEWGFAAFTGRSDRAVVTELDAQDGLYTLITRGPAQDRFEVVASLSEAHAASDHGTWLRHLAAPGVAGVTITVSEAGYHRGADGGLDRDRPEIRADVEMLRRDPTAPATTVPGRLVAGLAARRRADAGPLALIPCDNVAGNGAMVRRVVGDLAEMVDTGLATWMAASVSVVTTMVDRITPAAGPQDADVVEAATGRRDRSPVVCEPFAEWVLEGAFPAGRPAWEGAGATLTDDATPYEHRKLWLLNGAHSLLAYAGSARGHETVPEAASDEACRGWVEQWWAEASAHLPLPPGDVAAYCEALTGRFSNRRLGDRLDRIAVDGSQKLPIRIIPVLRAERAAGRLPEGATRILAAWLGHLRRAGPSVRDVRADELVALAAGPLPDAARRILETLDPGLGDDAAVLATVIAQTEQLSGHET